MRKTYYILLTLIMTIGFIPGSISKALGQYKYKDYTINERLIIGKKYDGKISDAAIARIDAKMEEIYALIEKSCASNETFDLGLNYIKDVNNLKSIEMHPSLDSEKKIYNNTTELLKILKKYPYIDVMVTVLTSDEESAGMFANSIAMDLYNRGLEKERMRVNGLIGKMKRQANLFAFTFVRDIQLVPSKEMIEKAIDGTL